MSAPRGTVRRTLAASALALALLAAITDRRGESAQVVAPSASSVAARDPWPRTVDAVQLAAWIREGSRELRVLDLRGESAYERRHVPSAEPADFARLDSLPAQRGATVVLYSGDVVRDAQAWATLDARGHRDAYVLNGGMDAWMEEVMVPVLHGDSADHVAALSRYFGGSPRAPKADAGAPRPPEPSSRAEQDDESIVGRRGC